MEQVDRLKELKKKTFIGLWVKVERSTQRTLIGTSGRIVDETKNLIIIEVEKNGSKVEKKIPKANSVLEFFIPETNQKVQINGSEITFRPYDRPKKA